MLSRDFGCQIENCLISPEFPINFRKSHRISRNYLKRSESYGQKSLGPKTPSHGLNRVRNGCMIKIFRGGRGGGWGGG